MPYNQSKFQTVMTSFKMCSVKPVPLPYLHTDLMDIPLIGFLTLLQQGHICSLFPTENKAIEESIIETL